MSDPSPISIAEATAHALWLVKLSLLDPRSWSKESAGVVRRRNFDDDPRVGLKVFLMKSGVTDEVVADRIARELSKKSPSLCSCVEWLSKPMLTLRYGVPELRPKPLAWRLARLVDPDGLLCLHPDIRLPPGELYDWPAIPVRATAEVAPVLRDGSIDTHVHFGGTLPPLYYWVLMMSGEVQLSFMHSFSRPERGHVERTDWTEAIRHAMWLRLRLAALLQEMHSGKAFPHLPGHESRRWKPFQEPDRPAFSRVIQDATLDLSAPQRYFKAEQGGGSRAPRPGRLPTTDPLLRERLEGTSHFAAGERRLLCLAGDALRNAPSPDVEGPLLEYLRIRNAVYQSMVLGDGPGGLARFTEVNSRRFFMLPKRPRQGGRRRRIRRLLPRFQRHFMSATLEAQLGKAFNTFGRQRVHAPRRAIELRVSVVPGRNFLPTLHAWLTAIRDYVRGDGGAPRNVQVGLIFHLSKGRRRQRAVAEYDALRLGNLLATYPELRPWIVGIDAAGHERATPPRNFVKSFAGLRQLEEAHRPYPGEPPIRLGRTYHVGEDVDDMLTGLRHVDETVRLLLGPGGGRLGHALVLGEDPNRFYSRRRGQSEPRFATHLLDLVWAWGLFTDERRGREADYLMHRVSELGGGLTDEIRACCKAMRETDPGRSEGDLLRTLGFSDNLQKHYTVEADDDWLKLVRRLQKTLRRRLVRQRVCIEANPTSNLLIGDYRGYHELPCLALVDAGFPVSLNTDDPGLFMTSLPGEFAAMYGAFEGTTEHQEILRWLSDRLEDAWRSSFLDHRTPRGADVLTQDLAEIFRPRL